MFCDLQLAKGAVQQGLGAGQRWCEDLLQRGISQVSRLPGIFHEACFPKALIFTMCTLLMTGMHALRARSSCRDMSHRGISSYSHRDVHLESAYHGVKHHHACCRQVSSSTATAVILGPASVQDCMVETLCMTCLCISRPQQRSCRQKWSLMRSYVTPD